MSDSTGRKLTWIAAGNLAFLAAQAGTLIVLARLGTPELVGRFALAMAIVAPVVIFFQLRLRDIVATDVERKYDFRTYVEVSLLGSLFALLVIGGAARSLGYWEAHAAVFLALGLGKLFETLSFTIYGFLQRSEKMRAVGRSMVLRGTLGITGLTVGLLWRGTLLGAVSGLALGWAVVLIIHDIPIARSVRRQEEAEPLRDPETATGGQPTSQALLSLALLALPLGASQALVSVNANIPRLLLERFVGEWELGIFSAVAYLAVAGSNVMRSLGQTFAPRLSRLYQARDFEQVRSTLRRLLGAAIGLGVAGILFAQVAGQPVLTLLYGPAYGEQSHVLVWIMIYAAFLFASMPLSQLFIAMRLFNAHLIVLGLSVLACLATGLALVPSHGIFGAASALTVGTALRFALSLFVVRRHLATDA